MFSKILAKVHGCSCLCELHTQHRRHSRDPGSINTKSRWSGWSRTIRSLQQFSLPAGWLLVVPSTLNSFSDPEVVSHPLQYRHFQDWMEPPRDQSCFLSNMGMRKHPRPGSRRFVRERWKTREIIVQEKEREKHLGQCLPSLQGFYPGYELLSANLNTKLW